MTCCNLCFEVSLGLKDIRQTQGHTFCGVPTQAAIAAYAYGKRPTFEDNRWYPPQEAMAAFIQEGKQVWMWGSDYFIVRQGVAIIVEQPVEY